MSGGLGLMLEVSPAGGRGDAGSVAQQCWARLFPLPLPPQPPPYLNGGQSGWWRMACLRESSPQHAGLGVPVPASHRSKWTQRQGAACPRQHSQRGILTSSPAPPVSQLRPGPALHGAYPARPRLPAAQACSVLPRLGSSPREPRPTRGPSLRAVLPQPFGDAVGQARGLCRGPEPRGSR